MRLDGSHPFRLRLAIESSRRFQYEVLLEAGEFGQRTVKILSRDDLSRRRFHKLGG